MRKLTDEEMQQAAGGFGFDGGAFTTAEDFTRLGQRLVAMAPPSQVELNTVSEFLGAEFQAEATPPWQAEIERLPDAPPHRHELPRQQNWRSREALYRLDEDYTMRENYKARQLSFRSRFTRP